MCEAVQTDRRRAAPAHTGLSVVRNMPPGGQLGRGHGSESHRPHPPQGTRESRGVLSRELHPVRLAEDGLRLFLRLPRPSEAASSVDAQRKAPAQPTGVFSPSPPRHSVWLPAPGTGAAAQTELIFLPITR